jgi:hypothetical protein
LAKEEVVLMNYEQKRLVVRVYLPGPPEKVVDWEAVAIAMQIACGREEYPGYEDYLELIRKNTTERPSRVDTGVDVVIHNDDSDNDGSVHVEFAISGLDVLFNSASYPKYQQVIAALGFPTEPQAVVETQAEGEASA